jgi:hypothetical protein
MEFCRTGAQSTAQRQSYTKFDRAADARRAKKVQKDRPCATDVALGELAATAYQICGQFAGRFVIGNDDDGRCSRLQTRRFRL